MFLPIDPRDCGKRHNRILNVLLTIIISFAFLSFAFEMTYSSVYVVGHSMDSTLNGSNSIYEAGGDYLYIFSGTPNRGDIVVIRTESRNLIKRVIAVGGDTVELKRGVLYLNGEIYDEPYVDPENNTPSLKVNTYPETEIPEGYIFVLGDNRNNSSDSRNENYGCIALSNVMGIVAEWSLQYKGIVTAIHTFFDFTLDLGSQD